jgi:hypothetical protein
LLHYHLVRRRPPSGNSSDSVTGSDAERLYTRRGWQRCGEIPGYALWPQGGLCSTTVFYRVLADRFAAEFEDRTATADRRDCAAAYFGHPHVYQGG